MFHFTLHDYTLFTAQLPTVYIQVHTCIPQENVYLYIHVHVHVHVSTHTCTCMNNLIQ